MPLKYRVKSESRQSWISHVDANTIARTQVHIMYTIIVLDLSLFRHQYDEWRSPIPNNGSVSIRIRLAISFIIIIFGGIFTDHVVLNSQFGSRVLSFIYLFIIACCVGIIIIKNRHNRYHRVCSSLLEEEEEIERGWEGAVNFFHTYSYRVYHSKNIISSEWVQHQRHAKRIKKKTREILCR